MGSPPRAVAAVAGRRIDAPGTPESRFPASAEPSVKIAVTHFLSSHGVIAVVASAACGADIIALEAAGELGIRTRIVLPFARERFRRTSVEDRGLDWADRFEAVVERAHACSDVVVLDDALGPDDEAYLRATTRILLEALELSRAFDARAIALAIWDEKPRRAPDSDATRDFLAAAERSRMTTFSIPTTSAA